MVNLTTLSSSAMKQNLAVLVVVALACCCLTSQSPSTTSLAGGTRAEGQQTPSSSGPFQITAIYNISTGVVVLDVEGDLSKPYTVVVDYDVYPSLPLPQMSPDFAGERLHLARLEASKPSYITLQTSPSPGEIIAKDSRAQYCITTNLSTFKEGTQSFSTNQKCSFMTFQLILAT
jgi:hypothetical protein